MIKYPNHDRVENYNPVDIMADQFGEYHEFQTIDGDILTFYVPWTQPYGCIHDAQKAHWL